MDCFIHNVQLLIDVCPKMDRIIEIRVSNRRAQAPTLNESLEEKKPDIEAHLAKRRRVPLALELARRNLLFLAAAVLASVEFE
jgi:hypothetical protein